MSRCYGRSTGMSINEYFAFLFEQNEKRQTKWTDRDILNKLKDEFKQYPDTLSYLTVHRVIKIRSEFNHGRITLYYPSMPSFRYDSEGVILNSKGNPRSKESIRTEIEKHRKRIKNA